MNSDLDNSVSVHHDAASMATSSVTLKSNDTSAIANSVTPGKTRDAYFFRRVVCPVCGQEFKAARRTATYCSGKCRQVAKRDRDEMGHRAYAAVKLLESIERAANDDYKRVCLVEIGRALEKALESLREK